MKIILSRKGFDSKFGGGPSPILPDGRMISLPIPSNDLTKWGDINIDNYKSYWDVMNELGITENNVAQNCHLDPDIYQMVKNRLEGWRGAFGQIGAAQTHLSGQNVQPGDLFLFFGWFRQTELKNGKLNYIKNAPNIHAIFGYLQIGQIMTNDDLLSPPTWLLDHPHCMPKQTLNDNNRIYTASDTLSLNPKMKGSGTLNFNARNVLTKEGLSRSKWDLDPKIFKDVKITYHSQKNWKDNYFDSAKIGQEFVIEENIKISEWAMRILENN